MDKKSNVVKSVTQEGQTLTVELSGALNINNADELTDALAGKLEGTQTLILEMKNLTYLTSAGIRVLVIIIQALSAHDGEVIARHVNEDTMGVLELVNIHKLITIE